MLTQLLNIDKFRKNISAIAFGEFSFIDDENWLYELETEFTEALNVPAASCFPFSHSKVKATVPIGVRACYDDGIFIE